MSLYDKIIAIYPELSIEDFINIITLQDDGYGAYIAKWEHPRLAKPTDTQLAEIK